MIPSITEILNVINQDVFILSAALLIVGFASGRLVSIIRLPRVTGYIIAGVVFGPSLLKVFSENSLSHLEFIPQLALGIIALVIGAGLSLSLVKRLGFRLILITLLQAVGAFLFVFVFLFIFKMPLGAALPLAAIATATAPAATVAVIKECRARGPFTETILAVVALDDAIAIILFGLVLTFDPKHLTEFGSGALHSLSNSFVEILLALVIGLVLGIIAHSLIKITKEKTDTLIIILGMVLLGIGVSTISHVSALLTNMFLGLTLINISSRNEDIIVNLERLTPPIYCFFFVLAGAYLNLNIFITAGTVLIIWGIIFVMMRIAGKVLGAYAGGALSGSSDAVRKYLGLTLIPQAGVAIGLTLLITKGSPYYDFRTIILNITLISVAFNEIIGPICTKYALFKAREAIVEK
ncbi:MAG: cation:proton antiporter [Candidatus Margulisiibacteriota bacterium]|nr:cation:proton antiporter [Candidatus Margulisiibacteriota bacterium]